MTALGQQGRTTAGTTPVFSRSHVTVPQRTVDDAAIAQAQPAQDEGWRAAIDDLLKYRGYADDWDGGGAAAVPADLVDSAILLAQRLQRDGSPPPTCTIPGVNGTVAFEWVIPGGRVEIEVVEPFLAEVTEALPGQPVRRWVLGR